MRENKLKQAFQRGESAIGTFVKITDPSSVEILALAGFDFFVLDTEHVAMDREQLLNILRAAEAAGITPLVRVRENNQVEILQNLDLGFMGVQVPNVDSGEEAKALVASVRYTPLGNRGLSPSVRACEYGTLPVAEYIKKANENLLTVAHCETRACVERIDEMLRAEGLDVVFIGPMDLSQSYGVPGNSQHPQVKAAIDEVIEKTLKSGKIVGTVAANAEAAKALIARGVRYILLSTDQALLLQAARAAIKPLKE